MPFTLLSSVQPERVEWLWPGRIPFGKLTILDGDPGLGKSTIMLDIAARLSVGKPLPGGAVHPPMGTIVMMVEDGLADTVAPRLVNAHADMTRIGALETVVDEQGLERFPTFPSCITDLANVAPVVECRLIVIDPIMSYLGEKTSSKDDQSVRQALTPLTMFAEETGIAVVMLRHFNKASNMDVKYRGQGSMAFIGLARSGLVVANDPDDPTRNIIASSKSNLGAAPSSLVYRLVNCENGAARVAWEGESTHTAQSLTDQPQDEESRSALDEAVDFLRDFLADGRMLTTSIQKAAREAGLSWDTVRRAQRRLRIKPKKGKEQDAHWTWELPVEDEQPAQEAPKNNNNNTFNKINIFKQSVEDVEDDEGVEDRQHVDIGRKANAREGYPDVPIVMTAGRYECVHCYKEQWMTKGTPQLCNWHRSALGLTGTEGD